MKANTLVSTIGLSREDWLQWRRSGIGSSDAGAVVGLNPWRSPFVVFLDKTGQLPEELEQESEVMEWGNRLEEPIARKFSDKHSWKVQKRNAVLQSYKHPFMLANLDRVVIHPEYGQCVLEIKTAGEFKKGEWDGDNLPDLYYCQVQHQLYVCEAEHAFVAVLIGGNKYKDYHVVRDNVFIEVLIQREVNFWTNHVVTGEPPMVDGSRVSTEYIGTLHPRSNGEHVEVSPEVLPLIDSYLSAQQDRDEAEEQMSLYGNQIKAWMGDNEVVFGGEHRITWKSSIRETIDTKRLREELPEVASRYLKQSETRTFRVK